MHTMSNTSCKYKCTGIKRNHSVKMVKVFSVNPFIHSIAVTYQCILKLVLSVFTFLEIVQAQLL